MNDPIFIPRPPTYAIMHKVGKDAPYELQNVESMGGATQRMIQLARIFWGEQWLMTYEPENGEVYIQSVTQYQILSDGSTASEFLFLKTV